MGLKKLTRLAGMKQSEEIEGLTEGSYQPSATVKDSGAGVKTVVVGSHFSIPLHPEHHEAISKLEDEQEHKFKDETNHHWTARRKGDTVHFQGANGGSKTSVSLASLKEAYEQKSDNSGAEDNAKIGTGTKQDPQSQGARVPDAPVNDNWNKADEVYGADATNHKPGSKFTPATKGEDTLKESEELEEGYGDDINDGADAESVPFKQTAAEKKLGQKRTFLNKRNDMLKKATTTVKKSASVDVSDADGVEPDAAKKEFKTGEGLKHFAPDWLSPKPVVAKTAKKVEQGVTTRSAETKPVSDTRKASLEARLARMPAKHPGRADVEKQLAKLKEETELQEAYVEKYNSYGSKVKALVDKYSAHNKGDTSHKIGGNFSASSSGKIEYVPTYQHHGGQYGISRVVHHAVKIGTSYPKEHAEAFKKEYEALNKKHMPTEQKFKKGEGSAMHSVSPFSSQGTNYSVHGMTTHPKTVAEASDLVKEEFAKIEKISKFNYKYSLFDGEEVLHEGFAITEEAAHGALDRVIDAVLESIEAKDDRKATALGIIKETAYALGRRLRDPKFANTASTSGISDEQVVANAKAAKDKQKGKKRAWAVLNSPAALAAKAEAAKKKNK